jgi:hypothetical protein
MRLLLAAFALAYAQPAAAQVWYRNAFDTPTQYGCVKYANDGHWTNEHLATGGYDGSSAVHVRMHGGHTQYTLGWSCGPIAHSFTMGDGVYIRFRIRFDDDHRWGEGWGNKFFLMGTTGANPNSRIIIYMNPPTDSRGCTLGMRDYSQSGSSPFFPWAIPSYYGLSVAPDRFDVDTTPNIFGRYGSLAAHVNIGWDCAPGIAVTYGNSPSPSRPGPAGSAAPVGGWYHVQLYAQSGPAGGGLFRMWANNNALGSPTTERIGFEGGLGVTGWSDGFTIGGYMDNDTPSADLGYRIDDVEVAGSFDPAWYPGGVAPVAPAAPTNLQLLE